MNPVLCSLNSSVFTFDPCRSWRTCYHHGQRHPSSLGTRKKWTCRTTTPVRAQQLVAAERPTTTALTRRAATMGQACSVHTSRLRHTHIYTNTHRHTYIYMNGSPLGRNMCMLHRRVNKLVQTGEALWVPRQTRD